jgi:hypothetical protein
MEETMRAHAPPARAVPGCVAAALIALGACRAPASVNAAPSVESRMRTVSTHVVAGADSTFTSTIEVRGYPGSPTVAIVGWSDDDAGAGLRTWVRRDGTPSPEHRLFVSTYYALAGTIFVRAAVESGPLQMLPVQHDEQSCSGAGACSPYTTFGARVTDALLREHREGLNVTFYARDGRLLDITVGPDLVAAYLAVVDSVRTSLVKGHGAAPGHAVRQPKSKPVTGIGHRSCQRRPPIPNGCLAIGRMIDNVSQTYVR